MRLNISWFAPLVVACGGAEAPTSLSAPSSASCEDADYALCGSPLPERQSDGQPWPTFSEALAREMLCLDGRGSADRWTTHLRGVCTDGKQFIATDGGFIGHTQYFEGERLVGRVQYTDIASGSCVCPNSGFLGTLATVQCEAVVFEPLCDTMPPDGYEAAFSEGTTYCSCDDAVSP